MRCRREIGNRKWNWKNEKERIYAEIAETQRALRRKEKRSEEHRLKPVLPGGGEEFVVVGWGER